MERKTAHLRFVAVQEYTDKETFANDLLKGGRAEQPPLF